jgi:sugar transferase (PEP-CTERM/EpsH1 system associated)
VRSSQRILHLITELNTGGAQKALARLLSHLDRQRFVPSVACLYNGDEAVAREIRAMGIRVTDLDMPARYRWDAFWRLYHLLRRERPTILHTWMFHANIPGRTLGHLAGVPIVVSSERTMGQESGWRYALNRLTHPLADRITCVSEQVADFVVQRMGVPPEKTIVIPNGLELEDFDSLPTSEEARSALNLPSDEALIGTVTRLNQVKRVDVLLEASARLQRAHTVIVGDGPERTRLEAMAHRLGLAARVHFVGQQLDVRPWLAALDAFVLSSDWEGMSNALLEAMAAGLPVVATAVGGTPEVVVEDVTGFLVPSGDPVALAEAITRLLRDLGSRRAMGVAGRARVERHFSIAEMVRRTEELYSRLLEQKGI